MSKALIRAPKMMKKMAMASIWTACNLTTTNGLHKPPNPDRRIATNSPAAACPGETPRPPWRLASPELSASCTDRRAALRCPPWWPTRWPSMRPWEESAPCSACSGRHCDSPRPWPHHCQTLMHCSGGSWKASGWGAMTNPLLLQLQILPPFPPSLLLPPNPRWDSNSTLQFRSCPSPLESNARRTDSQESRVKVGLHWLGFGSNNIPWIDGWPLLLGLKNQAWTQAEASRLPHSKLRSITPVATKVHVILRSFVVLTWMRDISELV